MADFINFDVKGVDTIFKNVSVEIQNEIDQELLASSLKVLTEAKRNAPVNFGVLRNSIVQETNEEDGNLVFEVIAKAKYAPYVEFGTGTKVEIPTEYTDYAALFKGKGKREVNMRAQPFLIPAFEIEVIRLIDRLKKRFNAKP